MKHNVGLVIDDRYLAHAITKRTPENPERLRSLAPVVRTKFGSNCAVFTGRQATIADIEAVHSPFYLGQLRDHCLNPNPFSYDRDTYLMGDSLATAGLAAGGCLELVDQLMGGQIAHGYALIRPPGHHAEQGRGMGFCIFNNVAITAQYLRRVYGLRRILIVDFDAHHGNGTQEAFYDTEEVLVVSLHQRDLFPFTGADYELGSGPGTGFNINLPVFAQFGDQEFTYLLGRLLTSVVEQYLPQIILVSAGYDGHKDDNISNLQLTTSWYSTITQLFRQLAGDVCDNRLLMVLEGGYNPESLEASVLATLSSLISPRKNKVGIPFSRRGEALLKAHPLHSHWTLH